MNKYPSVLLAVVMLVVAFLPAAASPPELVDYRIVQNGSCWLPDGSTRSTLVQGVKQNFHWVTPIRLVAFCRGKLPNDADVPKETMTLDYGATGRLCRVTMGQAEHASSDYTATVSPSGSTTITCRVDLK